MYLMFWLSSGIDDVLLASRALEAGVAVRAESLMYSEGNGRSGLVLGLGGFSNDQMEAAVKRLAAIIIAMGQA